MSTAAPTLWPYPEDVLHLLAPHIPYPTLGVLTRVNTLFNTLLTPHLYHTMVIDDRLRGLRLRRALQSPGAIHTRVLYIDAQHSCDECHAAGAPTLPNLQRVILSFDRGADLDKPEGVWPDDPCRTLSRARPDTLVVRVRNHFVDAVYPALRHHMPAQLYENANIVVSTLVTTFAHVAPRQFGWEGRVTQILLPPSDPRATSSFRELSGRQLTLRRLIGLAAQAASGELTLVGLEAYPFPYEGLYDGADHGERESAPVEGEGEAEGAFRGQVAREMRERARRLGMGEDEVEAMVRERMGRLRLVRLSEYLGERERVGEVPPSVAAAVLR